MDNRNFRSPELIRYYVNKLNNCHNKDQVNHGFKELQNKTSALCFTILSHEKLTNQLVLYHASNSLRNHIREGALDNKNIAPEILVDILQNNNSYRIQLLASENQNCPQNERVKFMLEN